MKTRCIIKRPDEKFGRVTNISTRLENLQKIVEGHIQYVPICEGTAILCNEEGKIPGLEPNFAIGSGITRDVIVGTAIIIGIDGEELCDIPISFETWKILLLRWGNWKEAEA